MDHGYKEVPFRGNRLSPWKTKSLPKFRDVPGRKFNGCPNAHTNDEGPPSPPPSPMDTFKYPALFRGSYTWLIEPAVRKYTESTNHDVPSPSDEMLNKAQLHMLRSYLVNIKPKSGKTKMYLWPQPKSTDCPKLDPNSVTKKVSAKSSKPLTDKFQSVGKFPCISRPRKSVIFSETGNANEDTGDGNGKVVNNFFGTKLSNEDFDVILKHALSHDSVIAKKRPTPQIQRSMIIADKPEARFRIKNGIFDNDKLLNGIDVRKD